MVKFISFILILSMISCKNVYKNKYGIYEPNKSNYLLKDKKGDDIPIELDTLNLYKYYGYYGENNDLIKEKSLNGWDIYNKYCSNGRFFSFGTDKLTEKNLDPNYGTKGYYIYNSKEREIKSEVYTNGNGGQFVILRFKISKLGDTLTSFDKNIKQSVYIRVKIPQEWKRFKSNW